MSLENFLERRTGWAAGFLPPCAGVCNSSGERPRRGPGHGPDPASSTKTKGGVWFPSLPGRGRWEGDRNTGGAISGQKADGSCDGCRWRRGGGCEAGNLDKEVAACAARQRPRQVSA